ncbi:MAG TPA: GGDEF domain-containing protein [Thermoanaerobaculia bacterium]|nr:GGDEF domain-containing protein [Thermoanaerobaculia bacterium]
MALQKKLIELSMTDALTGTRNRRALDEGLPERLEYARRYDRPLSLVLLDVDHFKSINDRRGHQAGDEVLRQAGAVAARIRGVTIRAEVASRPHSRLDTPAELVAAADQALYRAKSGGRNRVACERRRTAREAGGAGSEAIETSLPFVGIDERRRRQLG